MKVHIKTFKGRKVTYFCICFSYYYVKKFVQVDAIMLLKQTNCYTGPIPLYRSSGTKGSTASKPVKRFLGTKGSEGSRIAVMKELIIQI